VQEEAVAEAKAMEARSIQLECQSDLAAALPAVEAAIAAVQSIKKEHLVEVKAMTNPPSNVKLVMEALCIMFGVGTCMVHHPCVM
jgi:dynein heavy chain